MGWLGRKFITWRFVLGPLLLFLMVASATIMPPQMSFSLLPILRGDEEATAKVEKFQAEVPPFDDYQLFCVEFPRLIEQKELTEIEALARHLETDKRVFDVTSLADIKVVVKTLSLPVPTPFAKTLQKGECALSAASRHSLLERRLISADGKSVTFLVRENADDPDSNQELLRWLEKESRAQLGPDVAVRFIGDEIYKRQMKTYMGADLKRSLLIELLVFAIFLPLIFRTLRGIVIPLTTVAAAQLFCMALLVLNDIPIGLIDLAVPGIITMITVCDAVHMIHRFEEGMLKGMSRNEAIIDMMRSIGPACLFTSLTTAIGFISLQVARHPAVRDFGVKASISVLIAFLAIITIIPTCLAFWPVRHGVMAKIPGFAKLGYGRRKLSLTIFGAVLIFSIIGIGKLNIDSHWLEEMPMEEPLIADLVWYEKNFSGIMTFDLRVSGQLDTKGHFDAIENFQERLLSEPGINKAESYTHWVREVLSASQPLDETEIRTGLKFLAMNEEIFPNHAINPNLKVGRLSFLTDDFGTNRFLELRDLVDELNRELPSGLDVEVEGFMEMAHEASRLIVTTMLESFLISLLAISLLIASIFKSLRMGLVSILPNVFPIIVALGMNGWLDINLRIGIVMIYSLGLGLAVDDTIHLITRFRQERQAEPFGDRRKHILHSIRGCGPALVTTSIVLAVGSLSYLPSSFRSLRDVGVLLTTIVITALLADLWVLPHLLELAGKNKEEGPKDHE